MQLADIALAGPNHGLEQLVADPELKQAVRHEHIAGAATKVFADADLLVTDAHESIASHPSADPLLTVALGPRSQSVLRLVVAGVEAALRGGVDQRLVRTLRVVVANPFVQCLLCCLQVAEHLPGVELDSKRLVETLDLPSGGRGARRREQVIDPVLATDAVEEHLDRRLGKAPSEDRFGCRPPARIRLDPTGPSDRIRPPSPSLPLHRNHSS